MTGSLTSGGQTGAGRVCAPCRIDGELTLAAYHYLTEPELIEAPG